MSNLQSFLTGFFNTATKINEENRQQANSYYERQLERAQTIGVERLQARRAKAAEAETVAQRLMSQGNIPSEVIREAAKGGLDGLGQLEEVWKTAASSNIPVNETFWRDVYSVAKEDASMSGKPLVPAIGDVVKQAATPPKESRRSVTDYIFNNDAMDRAASKLAETEVVEGYSAADLLAIQDEVPTPTGGSVNWTAFSKYGQEATTAAAEKKSAAEEAERIRLRDEKREFERQDLEERRAYERGKQKPASVSDANTITKAYQEALDRQLKESGAFTGTFEAGTPEYEQAMQEARKEVAPLALKEVVETFGEANVRKIPLFDQMLSQTESQPQASTAQPTTVKPEGIMERINIPNKGPATFSHVNKAGKPVYKTAEGSLLTVNPEVVTIPGKAAPEATPQVQNTQTRLSKALSTLMAGQEPEGFFVGAGEQPPQNIASAELGTLVLKQSIPEGFVYGVEGDDSQDILIPKQ